MEGNQDAQQNTRREKEKWRITIYHKIELKKILLSLLRDHLMGQTTNSVILTYGLRIPTVPCS